MVRALNIFILTLLLISPMRLYSQTVNFEKLFQEVNILYSVQETMDNNYFYLIKVNPDGSVIWEREF